MQIAINQHQNGKLIKHGSRETTSLSDLSHRVFFTFFKVLRAVHHQYFKPSTRYSTCTPTRHNGWQCWLTYRCNRLIATKSVNYL